MPTSILRRAAAVTAAGVLLTACGGEPGPDGEAPGPDGPAPAAASDTAAAGDLRVVFQMTGLLLLVPPTTAGGNVDVLLPNIADPHVAWLGFGIDPDEAAAKELCTDDPDFSDVPTSVGICYVDLEKWSLKPFGAGGEAAPAGAALPSGLLNVTRVSGGRHSVARNATDIHSTLTFQSGWTGPNHCSLANWTYRPVNAAGAQTAAQTHALLNVVTWEVLKPAEPALTFQLRTPPHSTITVPLPEPENGAVELILAHVPHGDRLHLPPGSPPGLASTSEDAKHFHSYFNALRTRTAPPRPIAPGSQRRVIPRGAVRTASRACDVRITTGDQLRFREKGVAAIATYACMPAVGEGG